MDDLTDIRALYNAAWDTESGRLERHQLEADLTWRYLDRYLPAAGRLLEVGFGTGSYTFPLARRGYAITAVDLADENVGRAREEGKKQGLSEQITFLAGDARTLDGIPRGEYDAVLLMGPLYHLVLEADRRAALRVARSCLKPGGILFTALISRYGILGHLMKKDPAWIENRAEVRSVIKDGHDPDDAPRGGFRGYFVRLDEVVPMHERAGFETLVVAGVEPAISADDASYNVLEGTQRALWLDLLFEVSAEPSVIASSRHLLYVGRKPDTR